MGGLDPKYRASFAQSLAPIYYKQEKEVENDTAHVSSLQQTSPFYLVGRYLLVEALESDELSGRGSKRSLCIPSLGKRYISARFEPLESRIRELYFSYILLLSNRYASQARLRQY